MARYYVDSRSGCVAVRDVEHTDLLYHGLHSDTPGIVRYWHGTPAGKPCPTCGHKAKAWTVPPAHVEAARRLAEGLNAAIQESYDDAEQIALRKL